MKYAFMSFSTPGMSLDETIRIAERFGYDGIEPRLDSDHAHGIEVAASGSQRETIRQQMLSCPVALACLATSLSYSDPAKLPDMLGQSHERIDLAGDLAVPAIRVFGGKIAEGITREEAIENMVRALSSIAEHASERDVDICLETHDDWCDPRHVAAVMRQVGHESIAVNWDIMHPVRTGIMGIKESYELLRPWIKHVHVHDGIGKGVTFVPIGTGDIDHKTAIECLQTDNTYGGYISGEWIDWGDSEDYLSHELETLKSYE